MALMVIPIYHLSQHPLNCRESPLIRTARMLIALLLHLLRKQLELTNSRCLKRRKLKWTIPRRKKIKRPMSCERKKSRGRL